MPKFYCEYCGIYLTHSSPSGRAQHNKGRKHQINRQEYYRMCIEDSNDFLEYFSQNQLNLQQVLMGPPGSKPIPQFLTAPIQQPPNLLAPIPGMPGQAATPGGAQPPANPVNLQAGGIGMLPPPGGNNPQQQGNMPPPGQGGKMPPPGNMPLPGHQGGPPQQHQGHHGPPSHQHGHQGPPHDMRGDGMRDHRQHDRQYDQRHERQHDMRDDRGGRHYGGQHDNRGHSHEMRGGQHEMRGHNQYQNQHDNMRGPPQHHDQRGPPQHMRGGPPHQHRQQMHGGQHQQQQQQQQMGLEDLINTPQQGGSLRQGGGLEGLVNQPQQGGSLRNGPGQQLPPPPRR